MSSDQYQVDDNVEFCLDDGQWCKGKITMNSNDGNYGVRYDDGVAEGVSIDKIRRIIDVSFQVGDIVEGNYRERGNFYKGKISSDKGDGTYDILYDDGESETDVRKECIRIINVSNDSSLNVVVTNYDEGTKVEGNYRGSGTWYHGKISNNRGDGFYDILYNDGESESRVASDCIRTIGNLVVESSLDGIASNLETGMKVEANYRGRGKYYPGKISNCYDNGMYEIKYDDGEVESSVGANMIRVLTSELFPSWSLEGQIAPIVMNGISIDSILGKIAEQIAILKDRSNEAKQISISITNKLGVDEKTIDTLTVDIKALQEKIDTVGSASVGSIYTPSAPTGNDIDSALLDQQFNAFHNKLATFADKMETYEKMLSDAKEENLAKSKKISQLEDMVQKLTIKATTNEKTIESNKAANIKDLKESSQILSRKIDDNSDKIIELENNVKNNSDLLKFDEYTKSFDIMNKKLEDLQSKMNIMGDTNRAVENRVKHFELLFNQLLEQIASAKENIDGLGARLEYEVTDKLNRLDRDKSDRTEIMMKADVSLLAAKSDYSEITRIDEIIQELNRRAIAQRKEMLENMTSLQKDFTNRSENVASWCLKQLRKEFKKDKKEGADIGKVKCLVCDQVVDQNRDADIVQTRERELVSNMKTQKMTKAQLDSAKLSAERPASAGLAREYERNNPEIKKKSNFKPLREVSPSRDSSPNDKRSPESKLPIINNDPTIVSVNGNVNFVSGDREYLGITQLQFSQSASYFKDLDTRLSGGTGAKNKMLSSSNNRPMSAGNPYNRKK